MCAGCKTPVYCSLECQRKAWPTHKPLCQLWQRVARDAEENPERYDPTLRPIKERLHLLHDFREAHTWYIQKTIYYAMRHLGMEDNFDFSRTFILINLRYRPDCDDNPSVAFEIEHVGFYPLAVLMEDSEEVLEAGRPRREELEARMRATEKGFLAMMTIAYKMEDFVEWEAIEYFNLSPRREIEIAFLREEIGDRWMEDIQRTVRMGIVFRQDKKDPQKLRAGCLKKRKNKYFWEPFSPEKLKAMGFSKHNASFWCSERCKGMDDEQ